MFIVRVTHVCQEALISVPHYFWAAPRQLRTLPSFEENFEYLTNTNTDNTFWILRKSLNSFKNSYLTP